MPPAAKLSLVCLIALFGWTTLPTQVNAQVVGSPPRGVSGTGASVPGTPARGTSAPVRPLVGPASVDLPRTVAPSAAPVGLPTAESTSETLQASETTLEPTALSRIPFSRAEGESTAAPRSGGMGSAITIIASLSAVLAAFFFVAWLMKRGMPQSMASLPNEVLEVLGRAPLAQRQHVHLLRCGNRLLLVSVSQAGAETLAEITDPVEVDRLAGLCAQTRPDSISKSFTQVFQQFGRGSSKEDLAADKLTEDQTSTRRGRKSRGEILGGLDA